MVVTMQQVLDALNPEEPNYTTAAELGPDALPHLENIVKSGEHMLASKAGYLASLIPDKEAVSVLKEAAQHADPIVRVAATAGAGNLAPSAADEVLTLLENDQDEGVRKLAKKSMSTRK